MLNRLKTFVVELLATRIEVSLLRPQPSFRMPVAVRCQDCGLEFGHTANCSRNASSLGVSMLTPMEVPVGRDVLIAVVEDVLQNLARNRRFAEYAEDIEEINALVAQREQFLAWLRVQAGPNVPIALYPLNATEQLLVATNGLVS